MPDLRPRHLRTPTRRSTDSPGIRRCRQCYQELQLVRWRESPPRLGLRLVTEFYECPACDAGFTLNPETGQWKPWQGDDDAA